MIETPEQARDNGVKITVRCGWGRRQGLKTIRECKASIRLALETLIWTRGGAFPISMLEGRLKCPACAIRLADQPDRKARIIGNPQKS